jgi:predicted PurR-regulated permease PerM
MSREQLFAGFFFAVFVYLLYQTFLVFSPFLNPIVWGSVFALTFTPLQLRLVALLRGRETLPAIILTSALVTVVIVPTVLFGSVLTKQAVGLYGRIAGILDDGSSQEVVQWLQASPLGGLWDRAHPYVDQYDIDLKGAARDNLKTAWAMLVSRVTDAARSIPRLLLDVIIITMTFFVFLRDGRRIVDRVKDIVPMEREHTEAILATLYDTLSGVVQAMLATAIGQGILAGLGYWLCNVPFSLALGVLSGFLSLIPYAVPLVWGSCAIYLGASGSVGGAIFLCIWGIAVIGSVDNLIRPMVIGERANLSAFLLFFAILGGLSVYGFIGLLLGPVLVAIMVTFLRIYREEYIEGVQPGGASED